jgi:hypothetical protein
VPIECIEECLQELWSHLPGRLFSLILGHACTD